MLTKEGILLLLHLNSDCKTAVKAFLHSEGSVHPLLGIPTGAEYRFSRHHSGRCHYLNFIVMPLKLCSPV